jgi:RecB family exonuclease
MGRQDKMEKSKALKVVHSPGGIADIIKEELAAAGSFPLSELAVFTSSAALIHELRVSCRGLTGVTFLSPAQAASLVPLANGEHAGDEADPYLSFLVEGLIASPALDGRLSYFKLPQLRSGAGYAEALAATISELSRAALTPTALRKAASSGSATAARLKDIATIWDALDSQASSHSYTTYSRLLNRASTLLSKNPSLYPFRGRTVAFIDEQTTNALLHFLASVPRLTAVYFRAFPERRKLRDRLDYAASILDLTARPADAADPPPLIGRPIKEIDLLKNRLFRALGEGVEAAPRRSSADSNGLSLPALPILPDDSPGPDGTVHLEEHSGVEEELMSAVEWTSRQVLEHNVPLERIAILLPEIDPYGFMLAERLASLPFDRSLPFADPLPVYIASGIPVTTRADGSRLLALLNTLEDHLSADSISRFLPCLRLSEKSGGEKNDEGDEVEFEDGRRHLTFDEALELAYSCGTLGGLAGRADAAREWPPAIKKRLKAFAAAIANQKKTAADPDDPEAAGHARRLEVNERLLANLEAVLPAMIELVALHDLLLADAALDSIWDAIERFASAWVLLPPAIPPVLPLLRGEIEPLCSLSGTGSGRNQEAAFRLSGRPALRTIKKTLGSIRIPVGRFGEPRIYIGPLGAAAGLTFDAVRIMGLCEGAWPSRPPVDPILPDVDRDHLEAVATPEAIPRRDDRPLQQLCSFYRIIQGVRSRLTLSFAGQSADGTIKEPSSIYLEAATALRRPIGGKPAATVPSLKDLRLSYFAPAREAGLNPPALAEFAVCREVAGRAASPARLTLPASWRISSSADPSASSVSDLARMRELILLDRSDRLGPQDGIFPHRWPLPCLPGLDPASPLSASRIAAFLGCPHGFLLENILDWGEPPSAPSTREISQPSYGSLLHRAAEEFFGENGAAFTSSRRTEANWSAWRKKAKAVVERQFSSFLEEYPLLEGRIRDQQRTRLLRDFLRLLKFEWDNRPDLKFRAAEFSCGFPDPVRLELPDRPLFVRGYIDRLDELDGRLLIRDFKSGKVRPREKSEAGPTPDLDVQLAVYALLMKAHHKKEPKHWPEVGGVAYYYSDPRGSGERSFIADLDQLLIKGRDWLAALAGLIDGRQFPRTDNGDDCQYCAFVPVCGDQAKGEAKKKLQDAGPLVKRFLALREEQEEEESEE